MLARSRYVVVETCSADDPTQSGWRYSVAHKTVTGPGGLCLDNRTATYRKEILPQPENGQFQLRYPFSTFDPFVSVTFALG